MKELSVLFRHVENQYPRFYGDSARTHFEIFFEGYLHAARDFAPSLHVNGFVHDFDTWIHSRLPDAFSGEDFVRIIWKNSKDDREAFGKLCELFDEYVELRGQQDDPGSPASQGP